MLRRTALAAAGLVLVAPAHAAPELAGITLRGQGRFRYFGLSIYDSRLLSAEPVDATRLGEQPLML